MKERLIGFLKDDLKNIENNKEIMEFDIIQNFVLYWGEHLNKLID